MPHSIKDQISQTHKTTAKIILFINGEKQEAFLLQSGKRQVSPVLSLLFNIVLEIPTMIIRGEKETKIFQIDIKLLFHYLQMTG